LKKKLFFSVELSDFCFSLGASAAGAASSLGAASALGASATGAASALVTSSLGATFSSVTVSGFAYTYLGHVLLGEFKSAL
jgi:hypothetical protein